jgi:hypothetical protein
MDRRATKKGKPDESGVRKESSGRAEKKKRCEER